MGHFGSCSIFGSVRLWVGLLWVFGSKPVVCISDVGSGMDSGYSVRVSGLGYVLPGLHVRPINMGNIEILYTYYN